jgi:tRNA threonylcarbamoyl adenosine modification protein (Sua5/YciO/YrdC/YwlC family)
LKERVPEVLPLARALDADVLARLAGHLAKGGVLAIPTDTLYGLAADPLSEDGVARVYELKGRAETSALPVVVASAADLARLGVAAPEAVLSKLDSIWPAPLTAVLPLLRPIPASRGGSTLAVRVPALEGLRLLLSRLGPLTATSANPSGAAPARSATETLHYFREMLDFVLDDGPSPGGVPSTLVDLTKSPPRVLREGAFSWT